MVVLSFTLIMCILHTQVSEMEEKRQEILFWSIWAGTLAWTFTALVLYAPGVLRYLALLMGIIIPGAVVAVGMARALQSSPVPLPEDGWIGIEVPVSEVYPSELADGEQPADWKRTAGHVTPADFEGEEQLTPRARLRRDLVARRREGAFHLYSAGQDIEFAATEQEEEEEGRTVYVTEYNLKK